jgi:hypothetical protein
MSVSEAAASDPARPPPLPWPSAQTTGWSLAAWKLAGTTRRPKAGGRRAALRGTLVREAEAREIRGSAEGGDGIAVREPQLLARVGLHPDGLC